LKNSLPENGELWLLQGDPLTLAIDGTSREARGRVQVVEVSHLHRSTDGAINPRSNQGLCASCTSQGCWSL